MSLVFRTAFARLPLGVGLSAMVRQLAGSVAPGVSRTLFVLRAMRLPGGSIGLAGIWLVCGWIYALAPRTANAQVVFSNPHATVRNEVYQVRPSPAPRPSPTPSPRPTLSAKELEVLEQTRVCLESSREKGIEACRKALSMGLPPSRAATVLKALARKLGSTDRWDEVVGVYRQLVKLRPEDPDAHARLGDALLHGQDRQTEAEASYRTALDLKPDDVRALLGLAMALHAQGRFGEAIAAFDEAVRREPAVLDQRPGARRAYEASRRGQRWP